jgi:Ca-activated chloride channel family protein
LDVVASTRDRNVKRIAAPAPWRQNEAAPGSPSHDTEAYDYLPENGFQRVADTPLSTFSIDVDTASWANVRRFLGEGRLPPADAVRIEEMLNYFSFEYPEPEGDAPFAVSTAVAACPWQPRHRLLSIGLQGRRIPRDQLPPLNLVFLLDVSGSMGHPAKLPLLKAAMRLLVGQLSARDRVAIAVYAGSSGLVLPPTPGDHRATILEALDRLEAGGSTAGAAGIRLAYDVAHQSFDPAAVNRVLLATDGDFNVGISSQGELVRLVEEERERGVSLSVLGFGTGNLKDATMEQLADHGNGNYSYIDTLHEARKVLVSEAGGTLVTIAKDVKLQLEFNPQAVAAYRLIGYENRVLAARDFNDDRKDAGEIGAGHSVTALYEVVPAGVSLEVPGVDPLRYQEPARPAADAPRDELLTVKLRFKAPAGGASRLLQQPVRDSGAGAPEGELRFAAAVAAFGMLLRGSEHSAAASFPMVTELASGARGPDREGHRAEFVRLVQLAESLSPTSSQVSHR